MNEIHLSLGTVTDGCPGRTQQFFQVERFDGFSGFSYAKPWLNLDLKVLIHLTSDDIRDLFKARLLTSNSLLNFVILMKNFKFFWRNIFCS